MAENFVRLLFDDLDDAAASTRTSSTPSPTGTRTVPAPRRGLIYGTSVRLCWGTTPDQTAMPPATTEQVSVTPLYAMQLHGPNLQGTPIVTRDPSALVCIIDRRRRTGRSVVRAASVLSILPPPRSGEPIAAISATEITPQKLAERSARQELVCKDHDGVCCFGV